MNSSQGILKIHSVDRLVQCSIEMEQGAVITGKRRANQRAQAITRRAIGTDADNDKRTMLNTSVRKMEEQAMYNSRMDVRVRMWYF
ncbi:hypothetical protein PVOR_02030 [Paenibacillus vortex V453]|uniref:Uncharacterized protein n=1 Tax=Paenibacillus vortex V453 TaxID=715225 RepID=A0A2R9T2P4_9BACL|nr:hypothetical protein PVOR_02030 [Paenibacillus vortex V453]